MYIEEQTYWLDLVNLAGTWKGDEDIARFIPERHRNFESTPTWSRRKAFAFLVNNLDVLRTSHRRLETGRPLEYELLNNILESCRIRLFDWGEVASIAAIRQSKVNRGTRLETLQAVGERNGLNPGSAYVRSTVERAFLYFARYVDYRLDDAAYPEASPRKFRVQSCPNPKCRRLFVRTPKNTEFCGPQCAASS
jgi:hypothetical protein